MEAMPHLHLATIEHMSDYGRQMSIPYFTTLVGMLYTEDHKVFHEVKMEEKPKQTHQVFISLEMPKVA
jgi:hypothetical protein